MFVSVQTTRTKPSVVSVTPLPGLPLVLNVSISRQDVFRAWRTEGLVMAAAGIRNVKAADGAPITKTQQVAKCGNSVCPPMAAMAAACARRQGD